MLRKIPFHPERIIALCAFLGAMAHSQSSYRVLVGYNQSAMNLNADILATIELALEETSQAYVNSNIHVGIELAGAFFTSFTESGDIHVDWTRLQNPADGYMDELHTLRDRYAADIVVLLTNDPTYCGSVYNGIGASAADAFAIVDAAPGACITGNYSFAHEIGHLFGARHDIDATTTPFAYGHGYCNDSQGWRDIMATGVPCPNRQQFFSNPNLTFGSPAVPRGTEAFSNVARVHNARGATMGGFRSVSPFLIQWEETLGAGEFFDAIATTSVNTFGNVVIGAGAKARFRSNGTITLEPGFRVDAGADVVEIAVGGQALAKQAAESPHAFHSHEPGPVDLSSFQASASGDRLSLRYSLPEAGPMRLEVFRPDGKLTFTHAWNGKSPGPQSLELRLGGSTREGLMLIRVSGPGGERVRKIFYSGR